MQMRRRMAVVMATALLGSTLVLGAVTAPPAGAAPSDLDPSFGGTGSVALNLGAETHAETIARDVARTPDGKLVVAGTDSVNGQGTKRDFLAARLAPDGSLDPTFGGDGIATARFDDISLDEVNAVAVQPDGKVVVAGVTIQSFNGGSSRVAVARFGADGQLDATFGTGGLATVAFGTTNSFKQANAIALDSVGRIVLGVSGPLVSGTVNAFTAIRLTTNGTPDTTFSDDGIAQVAGGNPVTAAVAVGAGDSVLVAGRNATSSRTEFVRFTAAGVADTSFGTAGKSIGPVEICRFGCALTIDQSGRPLIAGRLGLNAIVQRLQPTGGLDTAFANVGTATLHFGHYSASAIDVSVDSTGRVVVTGSTADQNSTESDVGVARLADDGSLDATFDGDGEAAFDITGSTATGVGVVLDAADNLVVVALDDPPGPPERIGVARLLATDGSFDPAFDGDGRTVVALEHSYPYYDYALDVATDKENRVVAVGGSTDEQTPTATVVRVLADGTPDPSFGTDGAVRTPVRTPGQYAILEWISVKVDAANRVLVAGRECTEVGCIVVVGRFTSAGVLDPSFAGDGIAELTGVWGDRPDLVLDSRGRVVVIGGVSNEVLLRLTTAGVLDPSFAGGVPVVRPQSAAGISSLALDALDRAVIARTPVGGTWELARYDATGASDPTFGTDGTVTFDPTPTGTITTFDMTFGVGIDSNGRILVAGSKGDNADVLAARFDSAGVIDPTFGSQGHATIDPDGPANSSYPEELAVDRSGRAVVLVRTGEGTYGSKLVRFDADGAPDSAFGVNGSTAVTAGGVSEIPGGVAIDTEGRIVSSLRSEDELREGDIGIVRLLGEPAPADHVAPTATITSPLDGAVLDLGATIAADYSCADDFGGIGIDTCVGPVDAGDPLDTSTLGAHSFTVTATDLDGNTGGSTVEYSVRDAATATFGAGGGSVTTGAAPTADDPVETTVTIPTSGTVSIVEVPTSTATPDGYELAGQQVSITAPPSTAADPLTLTFRLDESVLSSVGASAANVQVFRDGTVVPACTAPTTRVATPDPCVFARTPLAGGAAEVSVYTSAASEWNFGRALVVPVIPVLVPGSASVAEGDTGTTILNIPVTLSEASNVAVTVQWTTVNNTATAPSDYTAASGTLTFAPGQTAKTVPVVIKGDTTIEPDELVLVAFSNATNATIGGFYGLGVGTIRNDDRPTVVPGTTLRAEGNSGTRTLDVPVTLSKASNVAVTVQWTTVNNTATAPSDYTAASGTLTFAPGQTAKTVPVVIKGDTTIEPDELVLVAFSNATNATIGGYYGLGVGTIQDDDRPGLSVNDVSVVEGNAGSKSLTFTVSLSKAATAAVTVAYATGNGTATAPSDYTTKSGTLTIAAGKKSATIAVTIKGDTTREPDETFTLVLANPSANARIIDASGTATITNND